MTRLLIASLLALTPLAVPVPGAVAGLLDGPEVEVTREIRIDLAMDIGTTTISRTIPAPLGKQSEIRAPEENGSAPFVAVKPTIAQSGQVILAFVIGERVNGRVNIWARPIVQTPMGEEVTVEIGKVSGEDEAVTVRATPREG